uniref:ADP-ribosylation factor-like 15 n=1 Tax=Mus musculus TaxID=10090 RepID=A0A286YE84_MOUSE
MSDLRITEAFLYMDYLVTFLNWCDNREFLFFPFWWLENFHPAENHQPFRLHASFEL